MRLIQLRAQLSNHRVRFCFRHSRCDHSLRCPFIFTHLSSQSGRTSMNNEQGHTRQGFFVLSSFFGIDLVEDVDATIGVRPLFRTFLALFRNVLIWSGLFLVCPSKIEAAAVYVGLGRPTLGIRFLNTSSPTSRPIQVLCILNNLKFPPRIRKGLRVHHCAELLHTALTQFTVNPQLYISFPCLTSLERTKNVNFFWS